MLPCVVPGTAVETPLYVTPVFASLKYRYYSDNRCHSAY